MPQKKRLMKNGWQFPYWMKNAGRMLPKGGLGGRSGLEKGVRKFGGVDKFTILIVSIAKVIKCKYLLFMERSKMAD